MSEESDDLFDDLFDIHHDTELIEPRKETSRAPFGWPGGKAKSIMQIVPFLPVRKKWIDHFMGSGIVTLNRDESTLEVCNDRYGGLTAFYRCLQNKDKVHQLIERIKQAPSLGREEFYHCKNTWATETDDVERAAKFYYMIKNSVIGKGHVFARTINGKPPIKVDRSLEDFIPIHMRMRRCIIENMDFEQCFNDYDCSETVHYFDPPYIDTDAGLYEGSRWNEDDLNRLLKCIRRAKGFCAMSGYMDERIDKGVNWTGKREWRVDITSEVRSHTKEGGKAHLADIQQVDKATEVLWIKDNR
jgi:DNA adenine methylase